ncbi:MAG: hypothetical protein ACRERE_27495 [Candidatus Entotheonellia bacterium]
MQLKLLDRPPPFYLCARNPAAIGTGDGDEAEALRHLYGYHDTFPHPVKSS